MPQVSSQSSSNMTVACSYWVQQQTYGASTCSCIFTAPTPHGLDGALFTGSEYNSDLCNPGEIGSTVPLAPVTIEITAGDMSSGASSRCTELASPLKIKTATKLHQLQEAWGNASRPHLGCKWPAVLPFTPIARVTRPSHTFHLCSPATSWKFCLSRNVVPHLHPVFASLVDEKFTNAWDLHNT